MIDQEFKAALIRTAGRLDKRAIEEAQQPARVSLRRAAKAQRDALKEQMKEIRRAAKEACAPLKAAEKEITPQLKQDITASNARIAGGFVTLRQEQADNNVLAFAVAAHDKEGKQ